MTWIRRFGASGFISIAVFAFSLVVFFYSPLRNSWREKLAPPEREILSVAKGRIIPDKDDMRIAKVLTREGIFIEVYGPMENGLEPLIDRVKLPDRRDGYMQFLGRATNLALQDLDNDGAFEIIAPTYDDSLVPHINIYKFDTSLGHLQPYNK